MHRDNVIQVPNMATPIVETILPLERPRRVDFAPGALI